MLTVHLSNRYEVLEETLLDRLDDRLALPAGTAGDGDDRAAFVPETVIVPSAAIRQAVTLALARRRGICAQIEFDFPARWLWKQIARWVPQVGTESPLAPARLTWRLFGALGDPATVSGHPRLSHYLAHADEVMRLEFAESLAQLFDQYVTYRPDWLTDWAQGKSVLGQTGPGDWGSLLEDERWQRALWQHLRRTLGLDARHPSEHFLARLAEGDTAAAHAAGLPESVHLFAVPTLPALQLSLLKALGQHADVHLYTLNPCQEFWLDVPNARAIARRFRRGLPAVAPEGNALVTAWGGQTQSQLALLYDRVDEQLIDEPDYRPPEGDHLLAQLQRSILEFEPLAPGSLSLDVADRSIEVHACHSLLRQIEVLHERLLGCFADPHLKASEVLVLVPDLEAATPLIEAVFGTAAPPRNLPYEITGRARSRVNGCARALLGLLSLAGSRFKASEVLAWMSQPLVARRFDLDEEALQQIREWIETAGIRWGRDRDHREELGAPASAAFTFAQGLDRLLLGYALADHIDDADQYLSQNLPWPAGAISGTEAAVVGRWWRLLDDLRAFDEACTPASAERWGERLSDALDRFLAVRGDEVADLIDLRETVRELVETLVEAELGERLPLSVIRAGLERVLTESARGGVGSGGITFSSLTSLRSLPYRIIAILGMDDGVFPSQGRALEYDLMQAAPRLGDRQRRHDDRNLFLDLVMAARDRLLIGYTGMSLRENASLPPSTVVSELLDALVSACSKDPSWAASPESKTAIRSRLWIAHPLQPFSPLCFDPGADPRVRSHDEALAAALRASAPSALALAAQVDAVRSPGPDQTMDPGDEGDLGGDDEGPEGDEDPGDDGSSPGAGSWPIGPAFFTRPLKATHPLGPPSASLEAPVLPPLPDSARQLTHTELIGFLRLPARYWLEKRLGLALSPQDRPLTDEEPLFPESRDLRRLARRLLEHLVEAPQRDREGAPADGLDRDPGSGPGSAAGLDRFARLAAAGTELPDTPLAELASGRLLRALLPIAEVARNARKEAATLAETLPGPPGGTLELEVDHEVWTLAVTLGNLTPSGLVFVHANALWPSDWLAAWVHHLCLGILSPPGVALQTRLVAPDTDERLAPVDDAHEQIRSLVALYRDGLHEPLPFFPRSAWAYTEKQKLSAARSQWLGRQGSGLTGARSAEAAHPAIRLAFRDREPGALLDRRFRELAQAIFGPVRHARRTPTP